MGLFKREKKEQIVDGEGCSGKREKSKDKEHVREDDSFAHHK